MRKCWKTRRKGIPGVYVEWYDDEYRRRSKYFAPRHHDLVKPFMANKLLTLNTDCLGPRESIPEPYDQAVRDYLQGREVAGIKPSSMTEIRRTLDDLGRWAQIETTANISQRLIDGYILHRRQSDSVRKKRPISLHTLNKDIRNLSAWLHWAQKRRYCASGIEIKQVKAPKPIVRALTAPEVKKLVRAAPDAAWRLRILLMATTGLRREDIGGLSRHGWDRDRRSWGIVERKTGKARAIPIPQGLVPLITKHLRAVSMGPNDPVFSPFSRRTWARITKKAGIPCTPHDLRRSFASLHAAAGTPIAVVQRLLAHADIKTTMTHYIGVQDSEVQKAVNRLKIKDLM